MSRTRSSERRFSARSAPTKSSTNSSAGLISSSSGVAYWASTPPFRRIATRSPILIASSMSWVTNRIVLRISDWRRRNWFCRRSRLIGSIAPKGSSISISGGSAASARATPTRWRWPPDSCAGYRSRSRRRSEVSSSSSSTRPAILFLVPAEQLRHDRDVLADREVREQADLLDHVADAASQLRRRAGADARPVDQDVARRVSSIMRFASRSAVVLPQPDGPTSTQISPAGTVSERSLIAGSAWPRVALDDVAVLDRGGGRARGRGAVPCHPRACYSRKNFTRTILSVHLLWPSDS